MAKNCCNISVAEVENGYRVDITGEHVKDECKTIFENCCTEEKIRSCIQSCCGSKE